MPNLTPSLYKSAAYQKLSKLIDECDCEAMRLTERVLDYDKGDPASTPHAVRAVTMMQMRDKLKVVAGLMEQEAQR
jgi:hypothetical protein